jgi:colicin import membrane protein
MSTKFRSRTKPPLGRGRWHAFVVAVMPRVWRMISRLSGSHWRRRAGTGVQGQEPSAGRFPLQPPRERDTLCAFGLALVMHAALAALLFSGVHRTSHSPASARASGPVRSASPSLASAAPRIADHPAVRITGQATKLAGGNENTPIASHHNDILRTPRARLEAQVAARSLLAERPHMAGARKVRQQANGKADRQHETRLAALQSMAVEPLPANDQRHGDGGMAASSGYADKVARRVRPNVIAPFEVQGNPSAVIAVTCAPNGALLSATVRSSSGNSQWDRAVLSAVERSDPMPRDVNGTTPASFLITFQPRG